MLKPVEISKIEDGTRLKRWFFRHYPGMPNREFYKLCRSGQVRVNSSRCRGAEILKSGDLVRIPPHILQYKQVEKKTENGDRFSLSDLEKLRKCIILNDEDIVVFNKPAGLAVQGGTGIKKSVDKMAQALFPYHKISLVHRIDRETSGILVVAKNQRSAQIMAKEFRDKTAQKEYLALLSGRVYPEHDLIDNFMIKGRVSDSLDDFDADSVRPQRAITEYEVISIVSGVLSWVKFSPKTGRTHQLRLHSALSLNAPIVGDSLYNKAQRLNSNLESLLLTNNLFLFAYKISFRHPGTGKITVIRAEMPKFMTDVAQFLELEIPK